jgi:hypothetical protein
MSFIEVCPLSASPVLFPLPSYIGHQPMNCSIVNIRATRGKFTRHHARRNKALDQRLIFLEPQKENRGDVMKICTLALVTAFALSGTAVLAQGGGAGSGGGTGSGAASSSSGMSKSDGTTGMKSGATTAPSASDASKSGAPTAASPNAHGTQAEPGSVQKGANPR